MRKFLAILLPTLALLVVAITLVRAALQPSPLPGGTLPTPNFDFKAATVAAMATAVPTPVPTAAITHSVAPGETMLGIALAYDVPLEEIMAANALDDPNVLAVGQALIIPGILPPTAVPTGAPGQVTIPPKPPAVSVNGLPESAIIQFSPAAHLKAGETFRRGRQLGRNPRAFSTAGDSTTEIPFFLARFDEGPYNLGDYAYLQGVIDQFRGSFARDSASVRVGLHSWTLFDPTWADKAVCFPAEGPLECEIRLNNPAILFLRLGSNDYGVPDLFDETIRQAVDYALEQGVIPVIGLKADRGEGSDQNNDLLRQIAADYDLLLWDFDAVANTMPGRGLDQDYVHMTTFYEHDYTLPDAFTRGHAMHNLTALMVLDTIWKEVILAAS